MLTLVRRLLGLYPELQPPPQSLEPSGFFSGLDDFQWNVFRTLKLHYPGKPFDSFCKLVAVKTANALAVDYHFRNRHSVLLSRPVQLQVDPTNACHMQCPSCLHSGNAEWSSRFDWPAATLAIQQFERFCYEFAPFATSMALFRDGEPLLHRRFADFVRLAKGFLLYTVTSTSLSMPLNPESMVASGLDRLVAAIDGGSAETYSRYRRGGDFDLVVENLRAIVLARRAQCSRKPWLVWQFLAFEHNVHEIESASRLASGIGVDEFVVARPHSVEHDDPGIKVAKAAPFGTTLFSQHVNWWAEAECSSLEGNAERIGAVFSSSWTDRYQSTTGFEERRPGGFTCSWLYYNLTMDGAQRITPCCLPPMGPPEPRHLVYARFKGGDAADVINSKDAILSRQRCRSGRKRESDSLSNTPFCIDCREIPPPPMSPDVAGYFASVDTRRGLPATIQASLSKSPVFAWPPLEPPPHGVEFA